jgi:hemoglobin
MQEVPMSAFTNLIRSMASWALVASIGLLGAGAPAAGADDSLSLFRALGEKPGLVRLMDDFGPRLLADARMKPFFKDVNMAALQGKLVEQVCDLAGGPCRREGPDMRRAHDSMDITRADFNALVEVLQESMDAQRIPFSVQNQLLARLAPMHRQIVNAP